MSKNLNHIPNLEKLAVIAIKDIDSIHIPFLKEIEGSTKQRIHNNGKDSNGNIIGIKNKRHGRYSPGYERKKRKIAGEHLYPINLQLTGDLMRSFSVGKKGDKPVLEFHDMSIYPISNKFDGKPSSLAAILEKIYKTDIYRPSNEQLEDAKEVLRLGVREALKKALKKNI